MDTNELNKALEADGLRVIDKEYADYLYKRLLEQIGLELNKAISEKKLLVEDVAKRLKWTKTLVQDILDGKADLNIRQLADIAGVIGFRWAWDIRKAK